MKKIILASTSPRRKEIFEKTGLPFEVVLSGYEQDMALKPPLYSLIQKLKQFGVEIF